jgi:hypothetical protein
MLLAKKHARQGTTGTCSQHLSGGERSRPVPIGEASATTRHDVTDEEFRACGYTGHARNFPLSDAAFLEKCRFNGADPLKVPRAWRFAPNEFMRKHWEDKATSS